MSNEEHVLEKSEDLPNVPLAPAPWDITGNGYIVAVWMPREVIDTNSFLPPDLAHTHRGRLALMMFVDYRESPCGAYKELLYIPGPLSFSSQRTRSITRCFVSTYGSVVNGRRNWGIPKDRADFRIYYGNDGIDRVRVQHQGHPFAEFAFQEKGPSTPFNAALIPRFLRTFGQHWEGHEYVYTPSATGHVQWATLLDAQFDAAYFPDLSRGKVLAVIKARDFNMRFQPATITRIAEPFPGQIR